MKVRITQRAEVQLDKRRTYWRAQRDERDLFDEEFEAAVRFLAESARRYPSCARRAGIPTAAC